jgi:hypothetical protein
LIPSLRNTSSKEAVNLLSRSWIRKRIRSEQAGEAEVAGLLNDPGAGRVAGAAGEVDTPAAKLNEEEHVQAAERDRLDREKVAGEHARGLLAKECRPAQRCVAAQA